MAPAVAADLAARPYTKAPSMIAAIYDWSGAYIGVNGGGASSRKCCDINNVAGVARYPGFRKAVTMRPAAWSAASSAIAGRPAPGCSALKSRGTGPT